ncbi:MAG: hypothetical protein QOE70_701 [Chthoniobacter sp.]|jgi:oligosaccharide repeat unit polymerase|nr:hypothetical protein [Chthoniobacter sp.]
MNSLFRSSQRPIVPGRPRPVTTSAAPAEGAQSTPHPDVTGTAIAIVCLMLTGLLLTGNKPSSVAQFGAIGVAVAMGASVLSDCRFGWRNLVRADLLALTSLYFLSLFEFLFPQRGYDVIASSPATHQAVEACLWGFGGMLIGRHLVSLRTPKTLVALSRPVPYGWIVLIFWGALFLGFGYMVVTVKFNVVEMVRQFMGPRFSQPWGRGQLGDWRAILYEFSMLILLVPPVAGVIVARRSSYPILHVIAVGIGLLFTLFYGFSSGTRNLFISYLITFFIGFAFAARPNQKKEVMVLLLVCIGLVLMSTSMMLRFREVGLGEYFAGRAPPADPNESAMHVDYNLITIGQLTQVFPAQHEYLGWEVPYLAIIRPIPRALWSGKPEGMSVSMETVMGAEGFTVAATFIGEAYMSGGLPAVFLAALIFGALTGWWNCLGSTSKSELGILVYASGFLAAVLSMRSLLVFTTVILPTIASIVIGSFVAAHVARQARRLLARLRPQRLAAPGKSILRR